MKNSTWLSLFVLANVAIVFTAQATIDPSQPTNLYTYLDSTLEWQGYENGNIWGLRLMPTYALNNKNMFQGEIPVQYTDFDGRDGKFGFGDIRIRYFGLPYLTSGGLFTAAGVSVDLFMPTGDEKEGLGTGSWIIAPGVLFGFMFTDWFTMYPIVSYQYTFQEANVTAGGPGAGGQVPGPGTTEEETQGWSTEVITVFTFAGNQWLQVIPKYSETFEGVESESFNVRLNYGIMLRPNISLTADVLHEFQEKAALKNHLRLGVGYYF